VLSVLVLVPRSIKGKGHSSGIESRKCGLCWNLDLEVKAGNGVPGIDVWVEGALCHSM
jgi:hypothetical protein